MISVAEAQDHILRHVRPFPAEVVALTSLALGHVLAEDITSDIDSPPFDKAMMDGYAVRTRDLVDGQATLTVIEEVTAGRTPMRTLAAGQATRIMTGSPVPDGADAVIPVEQTRMLDDQRVQIDHRPVKPGLNILFRGQEMAGGETVLGRGTVLTPPVIGLLASVGRTKVKVYPAPTVAVLTTGDEVVEANQTPGPGQIRNSNGPMLIAQVSRAGGLPRYLGIAGDRVESLRPLIAEGLNASILILSGGVSAGKLDLVPEVLQELGVEAHFHKVKMKPGRPLFFGVRSAPSAAAKTAASTEAAIRGSPEEAANARSLQRQESADCLVFGLPGNPVSSLVGFELFVRPAIRSLMGHADAGTRMVPFPLACDFHYSTDRPTYYPAVMEAGSVGWQVRPIPWLGSADLRALAKADALILFPPGDHLHSAGQPFPILPLK